MNGDSSAAANCAVLAKAEVVLDVTTAGRLDARETVIIKLNGKLVGVCES